MWSVHISSGVSLVVTSNMSRSRGIIRVISVSGLWCSDNTRIPLKCANARPRTDKHSRQTHKHVRARAHTHTDTHTLIIFAHHLRMTVYTSVEIFTNMIIYILQTIYTKRVQIVFYDYHDCLFIALMYQLNIFITAFIETHSHVLTVCSLEQLLSLRK